MAAHLKLIVPSTVKRTVGRRPNAELRTREHLTQSEVAKLIDAAKQNRQGHRDATMILLAYRHGLRASEVIDLRWDQVDFAQALLHVRRVKAGTPSTHPLTGAELRALRRLQQEAASPFLFVSERGSPFTVSGFRRMIERAAAGFEIKLTRICSDTPAGLSSPMMASIPERCKRISGTRISSTR